MTRPRGGLITGTLPTWTTTATSGIFAVREAQQMRTSAQWPRGPAAPTGLTATAGNTQLSLSWTAPTTTHGTITNYLVEYTASGGSAAYVLTGSTSTSYTLTGLTNGTAYTVRVAAVNFTAGDYSSTATGTPIAVALTVSPTTIIGANFGNPQFTFTGDGTSGSKLSTGGSYRQARFAIGTIDNHSFTCGVSGTLFFEWATEDDGDGGEAFFNMTGYTKNGSASASFAGSQTNTSGFSKRGIAVTSGDVIVWTTAAGVAIYAYTPFRAWIQ
jgi:cellulose 1,4-beta-cellobiosidase